MLAMSLKIYTSHTKHTVLDANSRPESKWLILHSAANPYIYYLKDNPNQHAYQKSAPADMLKSEELFFLSPNISFVLL